MGGSGMLNEQAMNLLLQDPELTAYLNTIGVDVTEAKGLFTLLDDDGSGAISIDEFVTGFLRLKGSAKAVDMVTLMYENRKISKQLHSICSDTRNMRKVVTSLKQEVGQQTMTVQAAMGHQQDSYANHGIGLTFNRTMDSINALGIAGALMSPVALSPARTTEEQGS